MRKNFNLLSHITEIIEKEEKGKISILKLLLENRDLSSEQLFQEVQKFYVRMPIHWIEKCINFLMQKKIILQVNETYYLSDVTLVGKFFYEKKSEINRILEQPWGSGDIQYIDDQYVHVLRILFFMGGKTKLDNLLSELRFEVESDIGPFSEYSPAYAKYMLIPKELKNMADFGLLISKKDEVSIPHFVLNFLWQNREEMVQIIHVKIRELQEKVSKTEQELHNSQLLYDFTSYYTGVLTKLKKKHGISETDEIITQLTNAFKQFKSRTYADAVLSAGRVVELLTYWIFVKRKGEASAKTITRMANQLSKLWKKEVPGQITTDLELVLSLISISKWLRDKKGGHPTQLTGFGPCTVDEARHALISAIMAVERSFDYNLV